MNTKPFLAAALTILVILLVTGCAQLSPAKPSEQTLSNQEICIKNGGEWKDVNVFMTSEKFDCVYTYDDANKRCTDASQCQSKYCKADPSEQNPTSGTCYPYSINTDDCQYPIVNGVPGPIFCA